MINALGLLEVYGFVAGVEAADAMLKSANVRLLSHTVTPPALVTIVIEGDLAACRAAIDAGSAAASRLGKVIARKEMGRPEEGTEWMVLSFREQSHEQKETPKQPEPVTEAIELVEVIEEVADQVNEPEGVKEVVLSFIRTKGSKGVNMTDVINHLGLERDVVKSLLHHSVTEKLLRKQSNRYYIVEGTS